MLSQVVRLITATKPAVALLAVVILVGCGSNERSPDSDHSDGVAHGNSDEIQPPQLMAQCPGGKGWRDLNTRGEGATAAATLGKGKLGVVFVNDSSDDPCEWTREGAELADRGLRVATFVAGGVPAASGTAAVARALVAGGSDRVVIIGASAGARATLQAAANDLPGVVGVVALSAERRLTTEPADFLSTATKVRVPALSIGSSDDPLTNHGADTRAFNRSMENGQLIIVPGSDHGVELLQGSSGAQIRARIQSFLDMLR